MKMLRMMVPLVAVAGFAQAADVVLPNLPNFPVRPTLQSLQCAAGKVAVNDGEAMFCSSGGAVGVERLTGPMVTLHKNGTKSSQGVYVNGDRQGLWTFFDEAGNKIREIEFKNDSYNGRYTEFSGGSKTGEQRYVAGNLVK